MKQPNVTAYTDYDANGRWMMVVEKKRGRLTLDEVRKAARDIEWDFYLLVLDCFHDEEIQYAEEEPQGDRVELYRTDLFYEEGEH